MSLNIKGRSALIAPRKRQTLGSHGKSDTQLRKPSVEAVDPEAREISNLTDQYAQSLLQQIQLLQIENSFLKKQQTKREEDEQKKMKHIEREGHYHAQKLRDDEHNVQEFEEKHLKKELIPSKERRGPTTKILSRGNEVSLNGEHWCQLPPNHPPIPAIISDRSHCSQRISRERSFYDNNSRDRREYSVPCFPRSRHVNSLRERYFVMNQTSNREESLMQDLEDAIERNIQLEKECLAAREREADNAKVINALSSRIKTFEMEKREEIDAMTNEKKSLLEELLDMQKRIDELAPACAEKELKIVATDNEKLDLTKRLRHANSDLSHLQAALKHLHEEIASKDNEIKALNDEIQFLKSRILATEEETRKMRIEDSESQDRISFYIQQSRELELTSINDKKLIDKVMEENSSLIKENARISTKLSRLETLEFSIKQKEVKETQTNSELVSELKAALQLEKSSSHILQNKIEIMRQRCEDLEKTILDRDRSEDENTAERSRVEKELNALHALSKSLSSENKILREEKLTNEEIIDELKGKIRALEMGIRSAQEIYQEKERQNAAKIQELAEDASKKHKKYLEFEEISKTLHQITALLPSKTLGMTQPSHRDCSK